MTFLTFDKLNFLVNNMKDNDADKEKFSFIYNNLTFDVIFAFTNLGYEFLIGIHSINFAVVLNCNKRFVVEMTSEDYFKLRKVLNFSSNTGNFNSSIFLKLLHSKVPDKFSGFKYTPSDLIPYLKCRNIDEADKIYFKGWNNHIIDKKNARNFDKTEFFLGKSVADYCRIHNISSIWTSVSNESKPYSPPWI